MLYGMLFHQHTFQNQKKEDWKNIAGAFYQRWNFPNCLGGSLYYNYKGTFSLNLMALVDANYNFTYINIGDYGSNADGSVLKNCELGKAFLNNELDVPDPVFDQL